MVDGKLLSGNYFYTYEVWTYRKKNTASSTMHAGQDIMNPSYATLKKTPETTD